jgi:hypothetical protein
MEKRTFNAFPPTFIPIICYFGQFWRLIGRL